MFDLKLLNDVTRIAIAAGEEILEVYNAAAGFVVSEKEDSSPITDADRRAHALIVERLKALSPEIPLLSEESSADEIADRRSWSRFWLIDPLDGTKEFVDRNGEFTVNIALIENGRAVAGVVHVPVTGVSYFGGAGVGAWKCEDAAATSQAHAISCRSIDRDAAVHVVASRRHLGAAMEAIVQRIGSHFPAVNLVNMGSSLKFCLLAEGSADIYPRLAPTSEWDTAAAHAILKAAGGEVVDLQFEPLLYNSKSDLLNPFFIALADPRYPWRGLLDKQ